MFFAASVLATGGCGGVQSALDPAGPAAAAIADTWWLMAIGATLIWALVMVLLWYTLARRQDGPEFAHGTGLIVAGGLVFPSLVLIALLVYGTAAGRSVMAMDQPVDLVVEVEGRQWFWTFRYLDADGRPAAATRDVLALPLDAMVEFRVSSADVIHSFWIPRLGGKIDVIPGRVNTLRLRADVAEPMRGQCAEFCGLQHAHMSFEVVTLPAAEFERWLAAGGAAPLPRSAVTPAAPVPTSPDAETRQ
ncbi:cytochrome c oxidase subunit II [Lysobacter sp. D1-1-M9]|uniref:cytochrome c oxidase subunit II n=1 Tax=Novilysobacter longmucuonensis TaxID=3098603 RepID=UPI002FC6B8C0